MAKNGSAKRGAGGRSRAAKKGANGGNGHFREDPPRGDSDADHGEIGHNSRNRIQAIKDAKEDTYDLDAQIDALMAKHIQPLRQQKSDIKSTLRKDFDISTKLFTADYNSYRVHRRAKESGDEITIATMKELYDATPIGEGLDMLEVMERADKKRADALAAKNKAQVEEQAVA